MILIVDYRQNQSLLLLADENSVRRFSAESNGGFHQLDDVLSEIGEGSQPEGVAVVLLDRSDESAENKMSWSTVRAAVSMGNSLAFAWGVPAARIDPDTEGKMVAAARLALGEAGVSSRVSALYDGEPNITKPKGS